MNQRARLNWGSLVLLKTLLIFSVAAGADDHHRGGRQDQNQPPGAIGGGPREGRGGQNDTDYDHGDANGSIDRGGNHGGGRNNGDERGGGRGHDGDYDRGGNRGGGRNNDGGWNDRDGRGGHDRGEQRGPGRGRRPDPNPYDPNPGYPRTPCERDPYNCGNGGGWGNGPDYGNTQRAIFVNQVFQQTYVDLNYLAGGVINGMRGFGLVGIDVEILNQWGPSTLRLIVNSQQVDAQNTYGRYVQLNAYQPIDLFRGQRISLGVQGRVHIGQIVLHFAPLYQR